jgi:hypothetical protein
MTLTLEMTDERVEAVIRALDSHRLTGSSRFTPCVLPSNGLRWPRFRISSQTLETPALAGLIFVPMLSRLLKRTGKDAHNMLCTIALSAKITNSNQESESFVVQFCGDAHC